MKATLIPCEIVKPVKSHGKIENKILLTWTTPAMCLFNEYLSGKCRNGCMTKECREFKKQAPKGKELTALRKEMKARAENGLLAKLRESAKNSESWKSKAALSIRKGGERPHPDTNEILDWYWERQGKKRPRQSANIMHADKKIVYETVDLGFKQVTVEITLTPSKGTPYVSGKQVSGILSKEFIEQLKLKYKEEIEKHEHKKNQEIRDRSTGLRKGTGNTDLTGIESGI